MFNSQNTSATFNINTDTTKKAIGNGMLDMAGIGIQYSVYVSAYTDSGLLISLPSKALYVNGQPVKNERGYSVFDNLVTIANKDIQSIIDEAVLNAMANKGVYFAAQAEQAKAAGLNVTKIIEAPAPKSNNFGSPSRDFTTSTVNSNTNSNNTSTPNTVVDTQNVSSTTPKKNHLPF